MIFFFLYTFHQRSNCYAVKLHCNSLNTMYFYHLKPTSLKTNTNEKEHNKMSKTIFLLKLKTLNTC